MKIETQNDGTVLASETINGRLKLCEANDVEGAWFGLVEMIDGDFYARADELMREYEERRGAA